MKNHFIIKVSVWALFALFLFILNITSASAATIIDEWGSIKTPSAPQLKPVSLDPESTALLLLDFNKQVCNNERRPRCIVSIPAVGKLLAEARKRNVFVVYSLTIGSSPQDIAPILALRGGEPAVTSGPDKFLGTDLEKILKTRNIKTVIVTGTAAHGAVINTASGAALRGMRVVVPVDGISADELFPEQYTVWHLMNAPRLSGMTTMTRTDMITFK
jgi:nicotinamidase-related amidase